MSFYLADLPLEDLEGIAIRADTDSVVLLCQTARDFNARLCQNKIFWRQHYYHQYSTVNRGNIDYRLLCLKLNAKLRKHARQFVELCLYYSLDRKLNVNNYARRDPTLALKLMISNRDFNMPDIFEKEFNNPDLDRSLVLDIITRYRVNSVILNVLKKYKAKFPETIQQYLRRTEDLNNDVNTGITSFNLSSLMEADAVNLYKQRSKHYETDKISAIMHNAPKIDKASPDITISKRNLSLALTYINDVNDTAFPRYDRWVYKFGDDDWANRIAKLMDQSAVDAFLTELEGDLLNSQQAKLDRYFSIYRYIADRIKVSTFLDFLKTLVTTTGETSTTAEIYLTLMENILPSRYIADLNFQKLLAVYLYWLSTNPIPEHYNVSYLYLLALTRQYQNRTLYPIKISLESFSFYGDNSTKNFKATRIGNNTISLYIKYNTAYFRWHSRNPLYVDGVTKQFGFLEPGQTYKFETNDYNRQVELIFLEL